jgi:rRNA maturation RNase YbeY
MKGLSASPVSPQAAADWVGAEAASSMEPPSTRRITILNQSGTPADEALIRAAAQAALCAHKAPNGEVCVMLGSDDEIRQLNKQHRSLDEATDVLTFHGGTFEHEPLGDIAISVPMAKRQADARGVSLDEELAYLAIHGALHLCGFEDEDEASREGMMREMSRVAQIAGLRAFEGWHSLPHAEGV